MATAKETPAVSAMKKLDTWFQTLSKEEQSVISDMVKCALVQVAESSASSDVSGYGSLGFFNALLPAVAPAVVKGINFPGRIAAYSIPGCNASALTALKGYNVLGR